MRENFLLIFQNENYGIFMTIIAIGLLVYSIYQKIKFKCLQKASEMVAEAEGRAELTGEEKFALVLTWINKDLPKVFKNSFFQTLIGKFIDFVYNNSFKYASNYIQRKTGYDISGLLESIKKSVDESLIETIDKNN